MLFKKIYLMMIFQVQYIHMVSLLVEHQFWSVFSVQNELIVGVIFVIRLGFYIFFFIYIYINMFLLMVFINCSTP